jgi:hypothetical protein
VTLHDDESNEQESFMMARVGVWLMAVVATGATLACASRPAEQAPLASAAPGREPTSPETARAYSALSHDGSYRVSFTPSPNPIPMNELFTLDVEVLDGTTGIERIPDAELAVDAAMPAHRHGMNRIPRVNARGNGAFEVTGMLFHMPGHWELYFDVTRGGVTERTQLDVNLE